MHHVHESEAGGGGSPDSEGYMWFRAAATGQKSYSYKDLFFSVWNWLLPYSYQ